MLGLFLDYLRYLGASKDKSHWFWGSGTRPKSRNHEIEGTEGSQISKSKSYKFKLEQNNICRAFKHIFSIKYVKMLTNRTQCQMYVLSGFCYWFSIGIRLFLKGPPDPLRPNIQVFFWFSSESRTGLHRIPRGALKAQQAWGHSWRIWESSPDSIILENHRKNHIGKNIGNIIFMVSLWKRYA